MPIISLLFMPAQKIMFDLYLPHHYCQRSNNKLFSEHIYLLFSSKGYVALVPVHHNLSSD